MAEVQETTPDQAMQPPAPMVRRRSSRVLTVEQREALNSELQLFISKHETQMQHLVEQHSSEMVQVLFRIYQDTTASNNHGNLSAEDDETIEQLALKHLNQIAYLRDVHKRELRDARIAITDKPDCVIPAVEGRETLTEGVSVSLAPSVLSEATELRPGRDNLPTDEINSAPSTPPMPPRQRSILSISSGFGVSILPTPPATPCKSQSENAAVTISQDTIATPGPTTRSRAKRSLTEPLITDVHASKRQRQGDAAVKTEPVAVTESTTLPDEVGASQYIEVCDLETLSAFIKQEFDESDEDASEEDGAQLQKRILRLETPQRQDKVFDSEEILVRHLGHWVTNEELHVIIDNGLVPERATETMVEWVLHDDPGAALGSNEHICRAYKESVADYPKVFRIGETRKSNICKRALVKLIAFNPSSVGMTTRRELNRDKSDYLKLTQRDPEARVSIVDLLDEIDEGQALKKSRRFFPHTKYRNCFPDIESCKAATLKYLGNRMTPNYALPDIEDFRIAYQTGSEKNFHNWYLDFHNLIRDGCMGIEHEMRMFLSLLATASPNSGVYQNTLNALLNFRAISQDCRPKWGSYPARSLLNYLAGALGAPSGMKISCFLDNLVHPEESEAVTIDTHMQKFILGTGHLSLSPYEYAILEDYYRCAAQLLGVPTPHSMQAAIWCTLAGPYSFKEELLQCLTVRTFRILPDLELTEGFNASIGNDSSSIDMANVCNILKQPYGRRLAVTILREKLLSIGYMSYLVFDDQNTWADVSLNIVVPLRKQHATGIKSLLNARKSYAKRQNRDLLASEVEEAHREMENLKEAEQSETGLVVNNSDRKWYERDVKLVNTWLLLEPVPPDAQVSVTQCEERDPYFKTHTHFAGSLRCLKELLRPGTFHTTLVDRFNAAI